MNEFEDVNEKEEYLVLKQSIGWKLLINELEKKKKSIVNQIVKEADSIEEINSLRRELSAYDYIQNIVNKKAKGEI